MGYIYMISNNYDTNVYIGQTRRPAETRWKEHIYAATHGGDSYMYRAMNKHGIENFFFEIIENVQDDKLNEREVYWISHYNSYHSGYNLTMGGGGLSYIEESEKIKVRKLWDDGYPFKFICNNVDISPTSVQKVLLDYGNYTQEESKHRGYQITRTHRPVAQYDNNGNFVELYPLISEAAKKYGIPRENIWDACNYQNRRAAGYMWRYVDDEGNYPKSIKPFKPKSQKTIGIFDKKDGSLIAVYPSVIETCEATGFDKSNIVAVCRGRKKSCYGFIFKYMEDGDNYEHYTENFNCSYK